MTTKAKPIEAWAIKSPRGHIQASEFVCALKRDCLAHFLDMNLYSWEHYEQLGYRCVKVRIEEI